MDWIHIYWWIFLEPDPVKKKKRNNSGSVSSEVNYVDLCEKNLQCNFLIFPWLAESVREKKRGYIRIRIPNSSFFLFYRILFPEFYSRVDCFAFFLIRYGLKKNLKGDIVFHTSSAFPVEKEINHSSGSQRFRMKDTFYYQTSEETVFSRFMAYGERKTGC